VFPAPAGMNRDRSESSRHSAGVYGTGEGGVSFGRDVQRFAQKSGLSVERIVREVELELYRSVVMDTPVKDGRLRANWFLSSGSPSTETTEDVTRDPAALLPGELASLEFPRKSILTNNLPYAIPIEEGHSTVKAPEGMVRKNARRIRALIARAAREHRV